MRIPGLKKIKRSARWIRSRFTNHALILGYHRIADILRDTYSLCVNPQHFNEHMEILQSQANPIHLEELIQSLSKGSLTPKSVVVTFDDGYADNLHNGSPVLEQHQIPATVFVVSGYLGKEFWWDELENILWSSQTLPTELEISVAGMDFKYTLNPSDDKIPTYDGFNYREKLVQFLYNKMLPMPFDGRREVLACLADWSDFKPEASSSCRVMTADELVQLSSGGLVDIGAHSVTHPILSGLEADEQRAEIMQSKETIEKILGHRLKSFSFPHGLPSDETKAIVRDSGFLCACSSFNDIAWRRSDPFNLPRFWIQDCDGNQFKKWLRRWLSF